MTDFSVKRILLNSTVILADSRLYDMIYRTDQLRSKAPKQVRIEINKTIEKKKMMMMMMIMIVTTIVGTCKGNKAVP